jgi:hypothetical protein
MRKFAQSGNDSNFHLATTCDAEKWRAGVKTADLVTTCDAEKWRAGVKTADLATTNIATENGSQLKFDAIKLFSLS